MASYEYDIWTAQFTGKRSSGVWSSLNVSPLTHRTYAGKHCKAHAWTVASSIKQPAHSHAYGPRRPPAPAGEAPRVLFHTSLLLVRRHSSKRIVRTERLVGLTLNAGQAQGELSYDAHQPERRARLCNASSGVSY